jgi:hypothetical protein
MPEETPPIQTTEENRSTYEEIATDASVDSVDPSKIPATHEELAGAELLHSRDSKLHQSQPVSFEQTRQERLGHESSQKPAVKISDWLRVLERTHMGTGASEARIEAQPQVIERIKDSYHSRYVIKPENVPESTFELEQKIARQQGHGDIPITDQYKREKISQIVADQEVSLDRWVDYLTSGDAIYPTWAKVWAFTEVTKMGRLEKKTSVDESGRETESASYSKRDETTTSPFPTINPRALALSIGVMRDKLAQKGLPMSERGEIENPSLLMDDQQFKQLLSSESFSKLYTQFLIEQPEYSSEGLKETRGVWKKYERGSEPDELVASLQGHPLEWCTANPETARSQLAGGDFYVYYSIDGDNNPSIPRVAIRMDGDSIGEVRGIAPSQELDPYISDVVSQKMKEFPDGADYQKKAADMKYLTDIEERHTLGQELSPEDLRFLYQLDGKIQGFGYEEDPRIKEIISTRDNISDLNSVFENTTEITGNLNLDFLTSAEGLQLPENVGGNLYLNSLTSAEGLQLPKNVGGYLDLGGLTSAEGLQLPESVVGDLVLSGLTSAEGLQLPENVGGNLYLNSLTSAEGLQLPESVVGDLVLIGLTSAEGLQLPENVGGSLNLDGLTSAEGLQLPKNVGGYLYLNSLTSAEGLQLPESVVGDLDLSGLTSAEGLQLPKNVGGDLHLSGLTSAEGLQLPESVGGDLRLGGLTSAEGLQLPESVGDDLVLYGLTSAEGLTLPKNVGGSLDLRRITSAEGLQLHENVGGNLDLRRITSAEGLQLPKNVGGYLYLNSLTSAEGLQLPESVGVDLVLSGLTSAEGLQLPESVGVDLDLSGLTSAEGLTLPKNVGGSLWLSGLTSAEGLTLPKNVGGSLRLGGLTDAEKQKIRKERPDLTIL